MSIEQKRAPNALWAYLLQKDLPLSSDSSATPVIPLVAPVDRTNTSMRMLIHDMQATLERFSTRVDTLLNNVKDAKTEVVNCNRISESERERVLDEITNTSKKVQTELKACIGAPSQASTFELLQKSQTSAESSIQALDKRIDAIQTLIQSQNHSMQAIQDQQHAILTAVLPLLPLVQAFPLHVDQAKTSIADHVKTSIADQVKTTLADNVSSSISRLSSNIDSIKSTLSSLSASSDGVRSVLHLAPEIPPSRSQNQATRKRTNSWLSQDDTHLGRSQSTRPHSSDPRTSRHKKPRLDGVFLTGSPQLARQSSHTAKSPKENALHLHKSPNVDRSTSLAGVSLTNNNNHSAAPWPRRTMRTPLVDILLSAPVNQADVQFRKPTAESSSSGPGTFFSTNTQTMHASPQTGRCLLPLTRTQMTIPPASVTIPIRPDISTAAPEPDLSTTNLKYRKMIPESAPAPLPVTPQPVSKPVKFEEPLRPPLKGYISISSSPLSSLSPSPPLTPLRPVLKIQTQHTAGGVAWRQVAFATSSHVCIPSGPGVPPLPTPDSASVSMSLRDRRAQMSVLGRTTSSAKRFIALGSSSDEEG